MITTKTVAKKVRCSALNHPSWAMDVLTAPVQNVMVNGLNVFTVKPCRNDLAAAVLVLLMD